MSERRLSMPSDNPVIHALDLEVVPEEVWEYAKREVGEDPDTRCQILDEFRDKIYEQGEIEPHRTDDAFLLRFLRAKKFVVRHAYKLLVNYYKFKENNPEFFEDVDFEVIHNVVKDQIITVPPYREQTGRRVMLFRMGLWDPAKYTSAELFQTTMLILELAILEPRAQILGGICMFDLGGLTMQQAWYLTPTIARQIFDIMVTSFPMQIKSVHIVNQPWIFEMIFNLFKPFLNEEMRERIFIHGDNMESLHKEIEPKYLPERYGGVHPDYHTDWMRHCVTTEKIRWELETLGYPELNEEILHEDDEKA
ncbi:hypothetical protein FQR65_LT04280 [Abscondita terminalis]|nr:hypothetical protein FQR65_LT04280 [Abscondita terminalis]